jgi:hypothetical protein
MLPALERSFSVKINSKTMANTNAIMVNINSFDVVFPKTIIRIESDRPIDYRSVQEALVLSGRKAQGKLSQDAKTITLGEDQPFEPGNHQLIIGELIDNEGNLLGGSYSIPFCVVDSVASVAEDLSVKSFVRLQTEPLQTTRLSSFKRPRKPYIEVMKAVHRKTGEPVELAFDQEGKPVITENVFAEIAANRAKKFGPIHESLFNKMQETAETSNLPVAIWLVTPSKPLIRKKEKGRTELLPAAESQRTRNTELTRKTGETLKREFNAEITIDPWAPVIYTELSPEQIRSLANRKEIAGIFFHETTGIDDLIDSIVIAKSDDVHTVGFTGKGIKVAVWESGPDVTTNLSISAFFDPANTSTSEHARHTHGIVKNKEPNKPHGHAPGCLLHSANRKSIDALRWAVQTKGCTVISQSFHRSSEPGSSGMSYDDLYKDYLALNWPFPTILQAAGNYWSTDPDGIVPPEAEYVNHKGYNSLAVGNHNDDASAMSGTSVFRNPTSLHSDRELPELCANGTRVTTVGLTMSGTSMAAPAAAGVTALLQQANNTLESWPEGCRAILLAGASLNPEGNTWWRDIVSNVDASDGSGAVDALESLRITQNRRSRNSSGTRRGWDVGTLRSRDIGRNKETVFSYQITIPRKLLLPRVKVALAWNSRVESFVNAVVSSKLTLDYDLNIYDAGGTLVGYSGSWDNSYEIAEFSAQRGQTYTIKIRRWSGTDDTWFGIAWTVRGLSIELEIPPITI